MLVILVYVNDECTGCGLCIEVCPRSVFEAKDGKAEAVNGERCYGCCSCVEICPVNAVYVDACFDYAP